ncbi:MAG: hypothetical protein ANABAC_1201 [Anaerolineae bacterium]|jgi:hypothetical protein|nr:MAG: hypothetical protein ANABAC_1201 [Anaerolineae bacterium]
MNTLIVKFYLWGKRSGILIAVGLLAALIAACGPDKTIGYQGRLTDSAGNPINGNVSVTFRLWTHPTSTNSTDKIFEKTETINVVNGLFNYEIGSGVVDAYNLAGLDPAVFAQPLWLELVVAGQTLSPRQKLLGAPYAMTLPGGAVIGSGHEGDGYTGSGDTDTTDINYGALTVVGGNGGTALVLGVVGGTTPGDIIRGCSGSFSNSRTCQDPEFRVEKDGDVRADGGYFTPAADFAEMIAVDLSKGPVEAGDVLIISPDIDRAVALSSEPYSTAIAGVYSTNPGFVGGGGGAETEAPEGKVPVAIVGIVPVKVSAENGPIQRGDLLTSASLPGHAMKATEYVPGAILGKAMGELESGTGVILVLLLLK